MNRSESINELASALSRAQSEIGSALKESDNPYFASKYADLSSVWQACKAGLTQNGLSVSQFAESAYTEAGLVVSLVTMLLHSSGEWLAGELRIAPAKQDAQSIGSCLTYMRRYALAAIAGVVTEDDDGAAASGTVKAAGAHKKPEPQMPPVISALQELVLKLCALDPKLTPDAVLGTFFNTRNGKPVRWDNEGEVRTEKQLRWAAAGIEVLRNQYADLLARHPEDESQQPDDRVVVPF